MPKTCSQPALDLPDTPTGAGVTYQLYIEFVCVPHYMELFAVFYQRIDLVSMLL